MRANGTSQSWTRPGTPPDAGGILRGCPLLGGSICPNVVSRAVCGHVVWSVYSEDQRGSATREEHAYPPPPPQGPA